MKGTGNGTWEEGEMKRGTEEQRERGGNWRGRCRVEKSAQGSFRPDRKRKREIKPLSRSF